MAIKLKPEFYPVFCDQHWNPLAHGLNTFELQTRLSRDGQPDQNTQNYIDYYRNFAREAYPELVKNEDLRDETVFKTHQA